LETQEMAQSIDGLLLSLDSDEVTQ
jgi:hypothetical protein